jgi:hypothetical protein
MYCKQLAIPCWYAWLEETSAGTQAVADKFRARKYSGLTQAYREYMSSLSSCAWWQLFRFLAWLQRWSQSQSCTMSIESSACTRVWTLSFLCAGSDQTTTELI